MYDLVYFSTKSGNTHKFVQNLKIANHRIPTSKRQPQLKMRDPYILVTPTYADGDGNGAVPKQVIRFLNDPENRALMVGVIAGGNTNFGKYYGYAGNVISKKCNVPLLYKFELTGTDQDIINVRRGVSRLWDQHNKQLIRA